MTGWLSADPIYLTAGLGPLWLSNDVIQGLPGWIDGNAGVTLEALGRLVAHDWLAGKVPWWNPYSGIGMPLAGEMQPAAFFLPFVLLLGLPNGVLLLSATLQIVAGLSTWALLNGLGVSRLAALTGAVLFEFNGTFAWDADSASLPMAFLPLMLLGIERALSAARSQRSGGWRILCLALAYALLAGFPERTFLDGLLAFCWAVLRCFQARGFRWSFSKRIATGGMTALLVCAPLLVAFASFLVQSDTISRRSPDPSLQPADFATMLFPYLYGPFFSHGLVAMWYRLGGYVSLPTVLLATTSVVTAIAAVCKERGLRLLLVGWSVLMLAKAGGLPIALAAWRLIPLAGQAVSFRYVDDTWEFAAVVLASFALDDLRTLHVPGRRWRIAAGAGICVVLTVCALVAGRPVWPNLISLPDGRSWFFGAVGWGILLTGLAALAYMAVRRWRGLLAAILVLDAAAQFSIPTLSGTREEARDLDMQTVAFLKANLGLSRFYTLGPLAPNFGAFFGLAQINHNYAPTPRVWVDYIHTHLDPEANTVAFNGYSPFPEPGVETRPEALRRRIDAYSAIGVKYVLSRPGENPFAAMPNASQQPSLVFRSTRADIYELPNPAAYFQAPGCRAAPMSRTKVRVTCAAASHLLRQELYFPGWRATLNGATVPVTADGLFQAVALPPGESTIRFRYAPPFVGWAYAAACIGLALLILPLARRPSMRLRAWL